MHHFLYIYTLITCGEVWEPAVDPGNTRLTNFVSVKQIVSLLRRNIFYRYLYNIYMTYLNQKCPFQYGWLFLALFWEETGRNFFCLFPDSLLSPGICSGEKDNCLTSVSLFTVIQLFKCKTLLSFSQLPTATDWFGLSRIGVEWFIAFQLVSWGFLVDLEVFLTYSNDRDFLIFTMEWKVISMEERGWRMARVSRHVHVHACRYV